MKYILLILVLAAIFFPGANRPDIPIASQGINCRSHHHRITEHSIRISRNAQIVCIGDSLTTGETAAVNWPTILKSHIQRTGRKDVSIYNEGEGGISSYEFWTDEPSEHYKKTSVRKFRDIHIAFILLGHNDTRANSSEPRNRNNNQTPSEYSANMEKIINWLKLRRNKSGITTRVVLIIPPQAGEPVVKNEFKFPEDFNRKMQQPGGYIDKLLFLAKKHRLTVITPHSVFDGGPSKSAPYRRGSSALIGNDSIHLNNSGQRAMAQCIFSALKIETATSSNHVNNRDGIL